MHAYWLNPISEPEVGGCDSGECFAFLRGDKQADLVERVSTKKRDNVSLYRTSITLVARY